MSIETSSTLLSSVCLVRRKSFLKIHPVQEKIINSSSQLDRKIISEIECFLFAVSTRNGFPAGQSKLKAGDERMFADKEI